MLMVMMRVRPLRLLPTIDGDGDGAEIMMFERVDADGGDCGNSHFAAVMVMIVLLLQQLIITT